MPHHHRAGPWWYFIPILLVGLLPWTPSIPAALARAWRAPAQPGFKLDRFLVIWAGVVVVFFSASHSKLPGYVLPAVPAILLLFARHYPALSERLRRAPAFVCIASGLALTLLAAGLPTLSVLLSWTDFDAEYAIWLLAAGLALSAAGIAALRLLRRSRQEVIDCVVDLEGDRATEDPKVFTRIRFHYVISGKNLSVSHVERAIKLSREKYCSATAMLAHSAEIITDYEIREV